MSLSSFFRQLFGLPAVKKERTDENNPTESRNHQLVEKLQKWVINNQFLPLSNQGKKKSDRDKPPTFQGLTAGDIQDWRQFIDDGKLKSLDEHSAEQMLRLLNQLSDKIGAFLEEHEKTLETVGYQDQFKAALDQYIRKMNETVQALSNKAKQGALTQDDAFRLQELAIILGEQSRLADRFNPKVNSPQEQLKNQLGVWNQLVTNLAEQYGIALPSGPSPRPSHSN